jgi:hypothetical protein
VWDRAGIKDPRLDPEALPELQTLVLDLERALLALAGDHPEAASAVVTLMMLQLDRAELNEIYGERKNPERWIAKAIAWMTAYLNGLPVEAAKGSSSCEAAYRRAR